MSFVRSDKSYHYTAALSTKDTYSLIAIILVTRLQQYSILRFRIIKPTSIAIEAYSYCQ